MQILKPHTEPIESEMLGGGAQQSAQAFQVVSCMQTSEDRALQ